RRAGEAKVADVPELVRIPRTEGEEARFPLSFAQQRLWFIEQLEPGQAIYNIPGAARLEGPLALEVLNRVVNELIRRHEALRTRFEIEEGKPVQVIDRWEPRTLELEDLTSIPPTERAQEASWIARVEAETAFDLWRGPLHRVKVLKLEEEEHML